MYELREKKVYCKNCIYFPTYINFQFDACNAITGTWTKRNEETPYGPSYEETFNRYAMPDVHNKYNTCKYYKEGFFYKLFKRWM